MMKYLFCAVCNDSNESTRFFHVPCADKVLANWSKICGFNLKSSSKICERHFRKEHISRSKKYGCLRLTKNAIPSLHLKSENKLKRFNLINEEVFDETKEVEVAKRTKFRDFGIQTGLEDLRICGFMSMSEDLELFNLHCFYCEKLFSIAELAVFADHVKRAHKQEDISSKIGQCNENNFVGLPRSDSNGVCGKFETVITEAGSNYEQNCLSSCNNCSHLQHKTKKIRTESEIEESKTKRVHEIKVDNADVSLMFGLIEAVQSYPLLWLTPKHKSAIYDEVLTDFLLKFCKKYEIDISCTGMQKSLGHIREWYGNIFKNGNYDCLSYPQSAYYEKCALFLPDNGTDGTKTCELCKRILPDYIQYEIHKRLEHQENISSENDRTNQGGCGILTKEQIQSYLLARWHPMMRKSSTIKCQICHKTFYRKLQYIQHIKAHINIREYVCDICGKTFVRRSGFLVHRRRHTGPIKRKCLICGKEFNDHTLLTNHRKRYHRPIEGTIDEIEESLKLRGRKQAHKRVFDPVTNRKFYACSYCDKKYKYNGGLHKHMRLWHKDKLGCWKKCKTRRSVQKQLDENSHFGKVESRE